MEGGFLSTIGIEHSRVRLNTSSWLMFLEAACTQVSAMHKKLHISKIGQQDYTM